MAVAVAYWTEYLDCDVTREEDRRMEELLDQECRAFEELLLGTKSSSLNF